MTLAMRPNTGVATTARPMAALARSPADIATSDAAATAAKASAHSAPINHGWRVGHPFPFELPGVGGAGNEGGGGSSGGISRRAPSRSITYPIDWPTSAL